MIAELTESQKAELKEWQARWFAIGSATTPADRPRAERAVTSLYRLLGKKPPRFIWCRSPAEATLLIVALTKLAEKAMETGENNKQPRGPVPADGIAPDPLSRRVPFASAIHRATLDQVGYCAWCDISSALRHRLSRTAGLLAAELYSLGNEFRDGGLWLGYFRDVVYAHTSWQLATSAEVDILARMPGTPIQSLGRAITESLVDNGGLGAPMAMDVMDARTVLMDSLWGSTSSGIGAHELQYELWDRLTWRDWDSISAPARGARAALLAGLLSPQNKQGVLADFPHAREQLESSLWRQTPRGISRHYSLTPIFVLGTHITNGVLSAPLSARDDFLNEQSMKDVAIEQLGLYPYDLIAASLYYWPGAGITALGQQIYEALAAPLRRDDPLPIMTLSYGLLAQTNPLARAQAHKELNNLSCLNSLIGHINGGLRYELIDNLFSDSFGETNAALAGDHAYVQIWNALRNSADLAWPISSLINYTTEEIEHALSSPMSRGELIGAWWQNLHGEALAQLSWDTYISLWSTLYSFPGAILQALRNHHHNAIEELTAEEFREAVRSALRPALWGQMEYWASFYLYCKHIGVEYAPEDRERLDLWAEIAQSCGWWWPYENLAILTDRPVAIRWDTNSVNERATPVLHCDGGPAVEFSDGWGIYALNGVRVPREVAETPANKLDAHWLVRERNAEARREIARKIGMERILADLNAKVVDSKTKYTLDGRAHPYELLMLDLGDGRRRPFLRMLNPSEGTTHIEGVPPRCRTVDDALEYRNRTREFPEVLT